MPAFRLPDDENGCPVFKLPQVSILSAYDLRPIELTCGDPLRIKFKDRRKNAAEATFLRIVPHPFHEGIVIGLEVMKGKETLPVIPFEEIDTITKLPPV